jgi:hypothetical protein
MRLFFCKGETQMSIKEENDDSAAFRLPKLLKRMVIHLKIDLAETCREALKKEVIRLTQEKSNVSKNDTRSR